MTRPLRVLTWHVHGSYLSYLARIPHELHLAVRPGRPEGYGGRSAGFEWPETVVEVPAEQVSEQEWDVVLTQSRRNLCEDLPALLGPDRLHEVAHVHLEHDPPPGWPNDARHPLADHAETYGTDPLLVHCTPFNELMWDAAGLRTAVVEHGVTVSAGLTATGELARGVAVVNNLARRGRRLGADVFVALRQAAPVDLAGMASCDFGGAEDGVLGDLPLAALHRTVATYRVFVNPIRYTSLGLAVCEAMMIGLPVVGLATTEMATAVQNGRTGYVDTRPQVLADHLRRLVADRAEAAELGAAARVLASERFGIERFARDWSTVLTDEAARLARQPHHSAGAR